jgi:uncharacterized membrane protein
MAAGATGTMSGAPTPDTSEQRKSRYNDIVTGIFGLILALGAFSVTNVTIHTTDDVWDALRLFVPSFFFVLAIWGATAELFDRYPADDAPFYPLVIGVLFLTTLAPVFLNLLLNDSFPVQELGALLFPLSMAATFALLLVLWARLLVLTRRSGAAPDVSLRQSVVISAAMVIVFLASLAVPFSDRDDSLRTLVWFAAFPTPQVALWLARRWTRR